MAANGKLVVQVTWQNVGVYDYRGKLLQSTPMGTFIRNAGLDPMPHNSKKGPDCLLVSASSDPLGKWGGVYPS